MRKVTYYWDSSYGWKFTELNEVLADEALQCLQSVTVIDEEAKFDRKIWLPSQKGIFYCKSAMSLIRDQVSETTEE